MGMLCSVFLSRRTDGLVMKEDNPKRRLDDRQNPPSTNDQDAKASAAQSMSTSRPATVGVAEFREKREGCVAKRPANHADSREEHQQHVGGSPTANVSATTRVKMCVRCECGTFGAWWIPSFIHSYIYIHSFGYTP